MSCERARRYGWDTRKAGHSVGCRRRVEELLGKSEEGQARLENAKRRLDEWTAAEGERIFARQGRNAD